ncbi:ATP-binding protein [Streptomyces sp. BI20]|uniref:ATP-binding protein n=1 Tax=Streptomyces sp. BI20 TaxID=3403460 RepID=UPI003C789AD1
MTSFSEAAPAAAHVFTDRFPATARGVRLARHRAVAALAGWGVEHVGEGDVGLVVAELAGNAVRHARVPGRGFGVRLEVWPEVVRVAVSDPRGDRPPVAPAALPGAGPEPCGFGLWLVAGVALSWGVTERVVGKTVWAELARGPGEGGQRRAPEVNSS